MEILSWGIKNNSYEETLRESLTIEFELLNAYVRRLFL